MEKRPLAAAVAAASAHPNLDIDLDHDQRKQPDKTIHTVSESNDHKQKPSQPPKKPRRNRRKGDVTEDAEDVSKRRCVSTACIACRYVISNPCISRVASYCYLLFLNNTLYLQPTDMEA